MDDSRTEWLAFFADAYAETGHPQGELKICTDCTTAPCEVGPEQVTLLPFEDEYIQSRLAAEGRSESLETIRRIAGCEQCPFFQNRRCAIHPHRPLDCRTYPLVPVFGEHDVLFKVSGVCPLRGGMDQPFIALMRRVWKRLLPRLDPVWKARYNDHQPKEYLEPLPRVR